MSSENLFQTALAAAIIMGCLLLFAATWDVMANSPESMGQLVLKGLDNSGVEHPVTAVLLNFRAYDTLLEILVLVIAFWGCWSLRVPGEPGLSRPPDALLSRVATVLVPAMLLIAVYLLWAGSGGPGGEFQAGAVLGAAGILSLLVGWRIPGADRRFFQRASAVFGALVFTGIGLLGWTLTGAVFGYPPGWQKPLMVLVETAVAISVGFILVALFAGGASRLVSDVGRLEEGSDVT